jgi:transporter family-2 protein
MNIPLILLVIAVGAGLTFQAAANSRLREAIGQPILAAVISFAVGIALLVAAYGLHFMGRPKEGGYADVPWWGWLGGLCGAVYVATAVVAVPKIGTATLTCAAVCGQLIAALAFDSLGLLGVPKAPLSASRIVGAVLLVVAVLLMQKK